MSKRYTHYVDRALKAPLHRMIEIKVSPVDNPEDVRNNIAVAANKKFGTGAMLTKVIPAAHSVITLRRP